MVLLFASTVLLNHVLHVLHLSQLQVKADQLINAPIRSFASKPELRLFFI
jgi:hypothetical protein